MTKPVTFSIVVLALLGLLGASFYQIRSSDKQTLILAQEAEKKAYEAKLLQQVKLLRNTAGADLVAFSKLVLGKDTIVPMIEKIELAGRRLGIDAEITSVEEGENGFRLFIEAEGDWAGAFSYLKAIENLPYRVVFERMNLDKSGLAWRLNTVIFLPIR